MRTLSSAMLQAIYAQETGVVPILLLTLSGPGITTIRVTSDAVNTVSNGQAFAPFPFMLTLPDDRADQIPQARLTIDAVDQRIADAVLKQLGNQPLTVTMQLVTSTDPDTIELQYTMMMREIEGDALTISGALHFDPILAEPFPGDLVTPSTLPGVFVIGS